MEKEAVIPGCLTLAQWTDMLSQEDAEETVREILDELLSKVMKGCFEVYIERQLAPFTASWTKSYLTQIVEHQILCLDEGEGPEEGSKMEDSEPVPAITDAWALGCLPVVTYQPQRATQQEVDTGQVPVQRGAKDSQQCNVEVQTNSSPKQAQKETSLRSSVSDKHYKVLSPCPPPKTGQKKKQHDTLPPKRVPGKLLPPLSCSTEKIKVEVEDRNVENTVSDHVNVSPYQRKSCLPIPRLDPSSLPRYGIFPQYEILDNTHTKLNPKKPNGLPRLEPTYYKQQTKWTVTPPKPLTNSKDRSAKFHRRNEDDDCLKKLPPSGHTKEPAVLPGPLRLDTIVLAKGVSLLDPKAAELNPLKCNSSSQSTKLRLMQSEVSVPLFSVDQVTAGPPPHVTPLFQPENCDT